MFKDFEADYKLAQREVEQLTKLYSDACWYNFETRCRSWKEPWHESWDASPISLRKYYTGSIRDAPALPPAIIFTELQHAKLVPRSPLQANAVIMSFLSKTNPPQH